MTQPLGSGNRTIAHSTSGTLRKFQKGELIYCQSHKADSMFILQSGRIKIERYTNDGKPVPLRIVRPGEMFGELSILNRVYFDNAVCELDSCVLTYPITLIQRAIDCQSETMKLFANNMLKTIQFMSYSLELRTIRSAQERVMRYLSLVKGADEKYVKLDRSYKDIAEQIGLTPEAFYRTLAKLERDGLISRSGSTIGTETTSDNEWQFMEYGINLMH
ncbi:MAG: Crp/Fnr family transcriptional regulator [Cyanobacteria bacterium P01_E01_bin.45]